MKAFKIGASIIALILLIVTLGLLALQNLASLIAIGTGILFAYYLFLFIVIRIIGNKKASKCAQIIIGIIFFLPIIIMLFNPEGLFNFLLNGIYLDMK
ncbi:hypothetical protein ULMS_19700 [Patiriisocius marinistellae]|uniref:Uncharacterized protein n=1 Tax=Patiriisocius marinistellae TaxID=2494560 RepID=A0A5J4FZ06_9FLAO|nr:hypothetical protein [Patiriisocius marinistellae]GEQ86462.1 hypothetical protein ULMS_19700 [Patiriisocius marinistellae]